MQMIVCCMQGFCMLSISAAYVAMLLDTHVAHNPVYYRKDNTFVQQVLPTFCHPHTVTDLKCKPASIAY